MMRRLSITVRLYLGFLTLLLLALAILGTISTGWFVAQQASHFDEFLYTEALSISDRLADTGEPERPLNERLRRLLETRMNRVIPYKTTLLILDGQGNVLARSNQAFDLSADIPRLGEREFAYESIHDRGPSYRMIVLRVTLGGSGEGYVRLACALTTFDGPLLSFLTSQAVGLLGSLLLLSFLGFGLLRLTLDPVKAMIVAASSISERDLSARIPVPPGRDELARLARTLNALLARLETDFAFQERLVGELTHQLKTPLTILRGRNELALTTNNEIEDFRELVEDNLGDIDTLVSMLNTLLELARLDSRIDRLKTQPVALKAFLDELAEEMTPLWRTNDLRLERQGPDVTVSVDPEALRQIFLNLLDNACKFAPAESVLRIVWKSVHNEILVQITNDGPPIPKDERELIFKRFFRSATQNLEHSGSGLGLSIVQSLVQLHGGTVRAMDLDVGAGFEFYLPLQQS